MGDVGGDSRSGVWIGGGGEEKQRRRVYQGISRVKEGGGKERKGGWDMVGLAVPGGGYRLGAGNRV